MSIDPCDMGVSCGCVTSALRRPVVERLLIEEGDASLSMRLACCCSHEARVETGLTGDLDLSRLEPFAACESSRSYSVAISKGLWCFLAILQEHCSLPGEEAKFLRLDVTYF